MAAAPLGIGAARIRAGSANVYTASDSICAVVALATGTAAADAAGASSISATTSPSSATAAGSNCTGLCHALGSVQLNIGFRAFCRLLQNFVCQEVGCARAMFWIQRLPYMIALAVVKGGHGTPPHQAEQGLLLF